MRVSEAGYRAYEPQLVPAAFAPDVWTVDGPEISYALGPLKVPCPTRMSVIRLADGTLALHSPVAFDARMAQKLASMGPVSALIAPNRNHFGHVAPWAAHFPDAQVFGAPGLAQREGFPAHVELGSGAVWPWEAELAHIFVALGAFSESVFVHRASATLIVTDLMMNYEAERLRNPLMRLFLAAGGAMGPRGNPSIDMRLAIRPYRRQLQASLAAIMELSPQRIILAHGKCYDRDGVAEIKRAFPGLT